MNRLILVLLLGVIISSCDKSVNVPEGSTDQQVSHQDLFREETDKMIQRLDNAISTIDLVKAPYIFNRKKAEQLKLQIQSTTGLARTQLMYGYSLELMKSGQIDQAILTLENVVSQLSTSQIQDAEQTIFSVKKQLAVAYMRKGEQENCIVNHTDESCIMPFSDKAIHILKDGSQMTIRLLNELLKINPDDKECQYLLNVAHMTLGQYPDKVPARYRIPPSYFNTQSDFPRFQDIASDRGVAVNDLSGGVCFDDFNGDAHLDIIASSWGFDDQVRYFENDGKGNFIDRTEGSGLEGITGGLNLKHADYDNDGNLDFIILRGAWLEDNGKIPNSLIKNHGNGKFSDVTISAGLYSLHPTQTAVWADFDLDGWVDLFIANETTPAASYNCELYRNVKGVFETVPFTEDFRPNGFFKGVATGDFNGDGKADLYLSHYNAENSLYINQSDEMGMKFSDETKASGVAGPIHSFPTWSFDYNNDGLDDIFVSGYVERDISPAMMMMDNVRGQGRAHRPFLYENLGNGKFAERSLSAGLTESSTTMGCNFGDLDNDGFLDFYLATGDPSFFSIVPNRMYRNVAGKKFEDVTYSSGFGHVQKGHAVGFGDMDGDGDQDIYAVMGGAFEGDNYPNILYENPVGSDNNWISIKLVGVNSNKAAVGARIKLSFTDQGKKREVYHTVGQDASFGGNSLLAELGVGKADLIHEIEVTWPHGDAQNTVLKDIQVNQYITITEGQ